MKVLVASFYKLDAVQPAYDRLAKHAELIMANSIGRSFTEDEIIELLVDTGAQIAIAADEPYGERTLSAAPALKMVARDGVGFNAIDFEAATRHGVVATNAPVLHETAADMAIALILAVTRRVALADRLVRSGGWTDRDVVLGSDVFGRTLGIAGFGRIGQAVAKRARGFDMDVIAFDPYPNLDAAAKFGVRLVGLDEMLAESDIISIHTPLTPETQLMFNAGAFAKMKDGAYMINMSRGEVVDEPALIAALQSGKLAGAGLDVLAVEPPSLDNPLMKMDNVVLTPHIGSDTFEDFRRIMECVVDDILLFIERKCPLHVLNHAVFERPEYRDWR